VILFGIIEFGLLLFNKQVITNASREGARYGIVQAIPRMTAGQINSIVQTYCQNYLIGFPKGSPSITTSAVCANFGDDLMVTVQYNYNFLVFPNLLGLFDGSISDPIQLTGRTVMKCE